MEGVVREGRRESDSAHRRADRRRIDDRTRGGDRRSDGPAGATTSAAGAVGTSGTTTTTLDPGVKAKLTEFRAHLKEFEKAANGSGQ